MIVLHYKWRVISIVKVQSCCGIFMQMIGKACHYYNECYNVIDLVFDNYLQIRMLK